MHDSPRSHPTTRVLTMLELLQAHHRVSGAVLAERLGVDERTVRRYAVRLAGLGVPVVAERGRYGGYRLTPGHKLPPLMLTDDEAAAVVLGLLAGRRLGLDGAQGQAAEAALAKVQRVLPAVLRERVLALRGTFGLTLAAKEGAAASAGVVLALAEAAREHRRVRLRHRSWKGAESEREFDPYGLVFHSGRWYVIGYDHLSGEVRTLRVDRVASARPGTAVFTPPEDVDPVRHLTRSPAAGPWAHEVEVVLGTTLAEARARLPPSAADLTETDGGVLMRARTDRLDGMARTLAGLGCPFAIRRPVELRDAVRELAERLAAHAEAPPGAPPRAAAGPAPAPQGPEARHGAAGGPDTVRHGSQGPEARNRGAGGPARAQSRGPVAERRA